MAQRMIFMAIPMMAGTLFLFKDYFESDIIKAWTVSLTTLAVFQWFNAWNCRHEEESILTMNFFSNKFLVGVTFAVIFLQLTAIYTPFLQNVLQTAPLEAFDWLKIIIVAFSIIFVEEARKFITKKFI
jgi:Ca2+-transporting ATPase